MSDFGDDFFTERYRGDEAERFLRTNIPFEVFDQPFTDFASEVRSYGIALSNERMRDIRREKLGIQFHERDIRRLSDSDDVPETWFYSRHGMQLSQCYRYEFEVDLMNLRTGETYLDQHRSLSDNQTSSVGVAKALMESQIETPTGDSNWVVLRIELTGVMVSPDCV